MPQVSNFSWTLVFFTSLLFFLLIMNNIYFFHPTPHSSIHNFIFKNFKFYFFF